MSYENLKNWRQQTKQMLVDCLGGKCNKCGYNNSLSALDFHHIDSSTKSATISDLLKNPRKRRAIIEEAQKCILLCKNCHSEYHDGLWSLNDIVAYKFDTSCLRWDILKEQRNCLYCDTSFSPKHKYHKYCTKRCNEQIRTSTSKPNKKLLEKLIWDRPMTKIAQQYKVSDKTIAQWSKSYNITRPPRGYFLAR